MKSDRFDLLVRSIGRRCLIGYGLVAGLGAPLALRDETARAASPCTERRPGKPCRRDGQCCSDRCKKRPGKRKGTCRCSQMSAPCTQDTDCCSFDPFSSDSAVCDSNGLGTVNVCCRLHLAPCRTSADCCSPNACDAGGFCRPE
jgi:hypothetical protein